MFSSLQKRNGTGTKKQVYFKGVKTLISTPKKPQERMSPVCFQSFPFSPVAKIKHYSEGRYIVHHQHLPYAYLPPTRQCVIYLFKVRTSLDVMEHLEEAYECKNYMKTVIYLQMTVRSITASVLSFTSECF